MSTAVSRGQALQVAARVATQVKWDELDGDDLQREVISLTPEEFGRRFTVFLQSGCRMVVGELKIATIPFDPVSFLGQGWKTIPEEHDSRSSVMKVDFAKAEFLSYLKEGERSIRGEEKLIRLKESGRTLFGANVFMGLWQDYQSSQNKAESVLEKLYQQEGVIYVDFFGDILRSPDGNRYVLCLGRADDGSWDWRYGWLGNDWRDRRFSAVAQQVSG